MGKKQYAASAPDFGDASPITTQHIMGIQKHGAPLTPAAPEGTILVGSDSELTLNLAEGSTFIGSISGNITNAAGNSVSTEAGTVNVTLGADCTWTLTADTYITSLKGDTSRINTNGHRLFVNGKELKV